MNRPHQPAVGTFGGALVLCRRWGAKVQLCGAVPEPQALGLDKKVNI